MVKCKECGKEISSKAEKCPHCGVSLKRKPIGCLTGIVMLVLIFIAGSYIGDLVNPPNSKLQKNTSKIRKADFEQVGYNKVKTRSGSYSRVFSVYTSSLDFNAMEKYAKKQTYTPGGTTMVFFFNDRSNTPDVTFVGSEFDSKYEKYMVAAYWKYPKGQEKFQKYPGE